ncbi:MAG: insulinase family protein [Acidimicrobiia bacterium]|nr:insulinase family protein [Acidimicrobiia bacterium]
MPASAGEEIHRTVLASGIRVVTERMPEARSVTAGFWVSIGSRDESPELSGASHFLEHLLFKGTEKRTAREIAETVDAVGGEMNAFTAKEHTAYYARLPATELGLGLDLLSDVVTAPSFRLNEVEAERQVILEELLMDEDDPDDMVHTLLFEALFPDHPLGWETVGTRESIETLQRDDIAGFFAEHYHPVNLVVAAAGALDHDEVVAGVEACFAGRTGGERPPRQAPQLPPVPVVVRRRDTEQAHVALGWRAVAFDDPARYALAVLNQVLGGGMASRLFQEVREERGLAYSVGSGTSLYADAGAMVVYVGTAIGRSTEALTVIDGVIADLVASGITARELEVAKGYLSGSMVLGLEDSGSRMGRLGSSETVRGFVTSVDEHLARIGEVSLDDVHQVAARVLGGPRTLSAVGPFDEDRFAAVV